MTRLHRILAELKPWRTLWTAGSLAAAVGLCGCGTITTRAQSADPFLDLASETVPASTDRTAGATPATASSIQQTALQSAPEPPVPAEGDRCLPPEQRVLLACPPSDPEMGCLPCLANPGGTAADEYLCDGGDRGYPVHYERGGLAGLNSEDAVAEFVDNRGKRRVVPTNQVCIYSPRFAAVTSVTESSENIKEEHLINARVQTLGGQVKNQFAPTNHRQVASTDRLVTRKRGSALYNPLRRDEMQNAVVPVVQDNTIAAQVAHTYLRTGILVQSEEGVLATGIQNALSLTRAQYPVLQGHFTGTGEVKTVFSGQEINGTEPNRKQGRLRIVKLADREEAAPGDVIKFTIRFDNMGDLPLSEVSIVDNLTPRLEYEADTASLDRDGELTAEDNGEGSLILRWTLTQPLPGHEGGVITFHAKVR